MYDENEKKKILIVTVSLNKIYKKLNEDNL